jgi:hypothetical protein
MASTVLSGSSNATYTNSTGQNVRVVINYMTSPTAMSWSGVSVTAAGLNSIGRNLAFFSDVTTSANNAFSTTTGTAALPTEIMLAAGQTFSATCGAYNIVIIPEAG